MIQIPLNSSPFPPLKPNVRYRTAMERAGFDVAFSKPGSHAGSRQGSRVASAEFRDYRLKNSHSESASSVFSKGAGRSVVPVPGTESIEHAFRQLNSNQHVPQHGAASTTFSTDFDFEQPGGVSSAGAKFLGKSAQGSSSSPNLSVQPESNSSSTYNTPQVGVSTGDFPAQDPVEQSFMQLTKNTDVNLKIKKELATIESREREDVANAESQSEYSGGFVSEKQMRANVDPVDQSASPYVPQLQPHHDLEFAVDSSAELPEQNQTHASVNFAPNEALNMILDTAPNQPLPNIFVTKHDAKMMQDDEDLSVPLAVKDSLKQIEAHLESMDGRTLGSGSSPTPALSPESDSSTIPVSKNSPIASPVQVTTEEKSTAVEKLLAELDQVSLNRDESISAPESLNLKPDHLKKSSAYLSRYEPQSINIPDVLPSQDEGTLMSLQSNSTPIFYNFKKDIYEPMARTEPLAKLRQETESNPVVAATAKNTTHKVIPSITKKKYPPGQGPCRRCNLPIVGKGIYSKYDNELSGQWHRDCFRCVVCDKPFSRKVPCYILDDQPYCQQHYHEKNNSICKICGGFIEGDCLENDKNERFHPSCLKCSLCGSLITEDYYVLNNKHIICNKHDIKQIARTGIPSMSEDSRTSNTVSKRRTRLINFS